MSHPIDPLAGSSKFRLVIGKRVVYDNFHTNTATKSPDAKGGSHYSRDSVTTSLANKMPSVIARALIVYPGAMMSSQIKGGGSYREAYAHTLQKIKNMPNLRSGSGAYVGASTVSLVPAALSDTLKTKLLNHGMPEKNAEHTAVGAAALGTAFATNLRNFAFTSGKHGLDKTKIFKTLPVSASFVRDTISGVVYSKALQTSAEQKTSEKIRNAVTTGAAAGALTSLPDTYAYMAASKEAIIARQLLKRSLRAAPIRALNVGVGAGILAWHGTKPKG